MFRSWCGEACVDVGNSGPSKFLGSKAMPSAQLMPLMLDISLTTASDGDNLHKPRLQLSPGSGVFWGESWCNSVYPPGLS